MNSSNIDREPSSKMSTPVYQIPAPDPFNFKSTLEWKSWKDRFIRFRRASGMMKEEEARVPEDYVTKEIFDAVSVYIIPKPQLQRTILTVHHSEIPQRVFLHVLPDNEHENQLTEWALADLPVGDLKDALDATLTGRKSSCVWSVMSKLTRLI
uniref:Uncharacterized protein n=1 Tax=Timema douglasi TaxID=61478 RepID=A0A7R8ZCJ1_TIMDO|nr:unnamed protein product [Timema douglasi]